jgi:hypothetical protein
MTKPRYTDRHRYPNGYTPSDRTDIAKTWAKAREQLEKDKQERAEKVRTIKQIGKR